MNFGRDIEHGGFPTSETRTIGQMRKDADLYAGIGVKRGFLQGKKGLKEISRETQKVVDKQNAPAVKFIQSQGAATETQTSTEQKTMTLTLKSISKNGKAALYTGARFPIRISLSVFPDKKAPESFEVADGTFQPAPAPRVKMTAEERKAARANAPKPTLAEKAAKAKARADKLAAELAAAQAEEQGGDAQL